MAYWGTIVMAIIHVRLTFYFKKINKRRARKPGGRSAVFRWLTDESTQETCLQLFLSIFRILTTRRVKIKIKNCTRDINIEIKPCEVN